MRAPYPPTNPRREQLHDQLLCKPSRASERSFYNAVTQLCAQPTSLAEELLPPANYQVSFSVHTHRMCVRQAATEVESFASFSVEEALRTKKTPANNIT